MIMAFIDVMRADGHAVESVCRVLREQGCRVAARTYRSWKLSQPCARDLADAYLMNAIWDLFHVRDEVTGTWRVTPESLYGRRKVTALLRATGHPDVAYCTVARCLKGMGHKGVRRSKRVRTTIPGNDGRRAGDLLGRDFTAAAPNRVWVTDFTYVQTWAGFVYVAFILDVYSRRIVAWHASMSKRTELVMIPLRMALWQRERDGHPVVAGELVHHSDAGSRGQVQGSVATLSGSCWDSSAFNASAGSSISVSCVACRSRLRLPRAGPRCRGGSGRCLWGSTDAAARLCSRSCHAATASAGRRSTPPIRCRCVAWRAEPSPAPWSQVSDRRSCSGSVVIVAAIASRTASAPWPASAGPFLTRGAVSSPSMRGRCSSIVNRVVRSTRVPIADLSSPMIRSPSQCPGTARSATSAGRALIITSSVMNPCRAPSRGPAGPAGPARYAGTRSAPGCSAPRPCTYSAW